MLHSSRVYFWIYAVLLFGISAAIWFFGPQMSIQGKFVLSSTLNRAAFITLIVLVAEFIRLQPRNLRETTSFDPKIRAELSLLRNSLTGAMKFLRKTKINVDNNKETLYQRPWHLLIGPPNSGKTALMANSGFKFILSRKNAGKNNKATRHVDWWVTREAVILDTNGMFTCQGTHPLYKKLWFTLLNWLKRNERIAQIQSVIIALNLDDMIRKPSKEQKKIFQDLHMRVSEVQRTLGHGFQIHILFTKCDLLAGFNAFFETLDGHEREQAWGLVLPTQFTKPFNEHVQDAWQQFMAKLQERVLWRMHHERNLQKRAQIKDFPLQIERAQALITDLAEHLPPINDRKESDRYSLQLSGIFFCSTSQKEQAYDHLLAPLSDSFALMTMDDAVVVNPELNYFTKQLFMDVIFEGAQVTQMKKAMAFQQGLRYGMYASAAVIVAVSTMALVQSFQGQLSDIDAAKKAITEYELLAKQAQDEPSLKSLLPALDALDKAQLSMQHAPRKLIRDINRQHQQLPEMMQKSYDKTVITTIVPKLKSDIETQLKLMLAEKSADRIGYFYSTMKVYQMLAKPSRMDVDAVERWLGQFWFENNIGNKKQLSQLKPHIAKAFQRLSQPIKLNQHLNAQSKLYLAKMSNSQLAQAILHDLADGSAEKAVALPVALTESQSSIFHGPATTVPYLYSHTGFFHGFAPHYHQAAEEALMGNWVIGAKLPPDSASQQIQALEKELAGAYAKQYINQWQNVLDKTRFNHFYSFKQAKDILQHFPHGESDLSKLTAALRTHTQFSHLDEPTDVVKSTAREIHQHFRAVNDRLNKHPELFIESAFTRLQQALVLMTRAADDLDASFQFTKMQFTAKQPLLNQIQYGIDELPKSMQAWFQGFVDEFWQRSLENSAEYVQQQWQSTIWKEYSKRIAGRYPVVQNAKKEISPQEFSHFYGPKGRLSEFLRTYVAPFMVADKQGKHQYWKSIANQQMPLSDQILKVAEQLEQVNKQFFHGNSNQVEVNFSLIANALSPTIKSFIMKLDGHALEYPNGATSLGNVRWPNPRTRHHDVLVSVKTDQDAVKKIKTSGSWALFKFLNKAKLESTKDPKRFVLTINMDKHALKYELIADSQFNPFSAKIFNQLTLPQEI